MKKVLNCIVCVVFITIMHCGWVHAYCKGRYHVYTLCALSFTQPHQQLSSSLKERLKRSRRSFTSPFSVAKRLCVEDLEEAGQQVSADSRETVNNPPVIMCNVDVNRNESRTGSERFSGLIPEPTHLPSKDLSRRQDQLKKEVKDKMETLRRLKMVKMYRSKVPAIFKLSVLLPS